MVNMGKIKKIRGLSSTYNRSRALLPFGTVVKSCRSGINSCSSSIELDAQNVQPHQKTIKRKRPHLESMCLPATSFMVMCRFKSLSCREKTRFLVVRTGFTMAEMHSARCTGTAGPAGHRKKAGKR